MIRRIVLCLPITVVLLTIYLAEAQQTKVPRIGMLVNGTPSSHKFIIDNSNRGYAISAMWKGKIFFSKSDTPRGNWTACPSLRESSCK